MAAGEARSWWQVAVCVDTDSVGLVLEAGLIQQLTNCLRQCPAVEVQLKIVTVIALLVPPTP